ncbi:phosphomannomutase [uncultured Thioclava sp.]|uniref:phosphomannomutase n=1 Tax=uncultured Thioclava sp. TaxID=473858 RepID=UPI0025F6FE00|nr:phosphomannomutase [uncultured Thioclava sp.]
MAPKFGTSGLRGLVVELTPTLVGDYTRAFLAACPTGGAVHLGRDLRPSSPAIAQAVRTALRDDGMSVIDCGALPTPALALSAMAQDHAAIMVTGSHIPADRNGLKFYVPTGEISKEDERAINAHLGRNPANVSAGFQREDATAATDYLARYVSAYGPEALRGMRIGIYQHSSVARDLMVAAIEGLGGTAIPLGRSDTFIPVDTEALDTQTRTMLSGWCREHGLDAIISTDGDADRPMVADATGRIVVGDVLGALTARSLSAQVICTPVSSNSMIFEMPEFEAIHLTKIGSPFVIEAMEQVRAQTPNARVVGYEANGGFLLGFEAAGPAGTLAPLMTRDCLLPILAPLVTARAAGQPLADIVAALPPRFTAADRIAGIASATAQTFLVQLAQDTSARQAFFAEEAAQTDLDLTDGLRVRFEGGSVVHLRPSGNAPEFRCYAEADRSETAQTLVSRYLGKVRELLG